eukprot:5042107-Pleurochrysis_carterae.AAC.1
MHMCDAAAAPIPASRRHTRQITHGLPKLGSRNLLFSTFHSDKTCICCCAELLSCRQMCPLCVCWERAAGIVRRTTFTAATALLAPRRQSAQARAALLTHTSNAPVLARSECSRACARAVAPRAHTCLRACRPPPRVARARRLPARSNVRPLRRRRARPSQAWRLRTSTRATAASPSRCTATARRTRVSALALLLLGLKGLAHARSQCPFLSQATSQKRSQPGTGGAHFEQGFEEGWRIGLGECLCRRDAAQVSCTR